MNVLVACECSGRVREAFRARGHNARSIDVLPDAEGSPDHITGPFGDFQELEKIDLLVAFPPCTHLAVSGARWFPEKIADGRQGAAIDFFMSLVDAPVKRIAIENSVGIMSTRYRKPDQIVQPWQFGHGEVKATCLWLKGLPELKPTDIVSGREPRIWKMGPSPERGHLRSVTYQGLANAMASQWG